MNQRELIDYIRSERAQGSTEEQLVTRLTSAGWPLADVKAAFSELDRAGVFKIDPAEMPNLVPVKKHHVLRFVFEVIACLAILFIVFSVLFNKGLIPQVQPPFAASTSTAPIVTKISTTTPRETPSPSAINSNASTTMSYAGETTPAPLSFSANANSNVSDSDKSQVIAALLTQNNIYSSGNASNIKNYIQAAGIPADQAKIAGMTDSEIVAYAESIISGSQNLTATQLQSADIIWRQEGSTVYVTIPGAAKNITRTSTEINSTWY